MRKNKINKKLYLVSGIIISIIILSTIILFYNTNKPQSIQKLTDNDFKILSASWDDYAMEFNGNDYVADTNQQIYWDKFCDACKNGIPNAHNSDGTQYIPSCLTSGYHLVIEASQTLVYNVAIDGIYTEKLKDVSQDMSSLKEGVQNIPVILSDGAKTNQQIFSNLDARKSHEINLCATDVWRKSGFICKSITLPAKC